LCFGVFNLSSSLSVGGPRGQGTGDRGQGTGTRENRGQEPGKIGGGRHEWKRQEAGEKRTGSGSSKKVGIIY